MKKYEVTIYGRTNTILTGIRSKKLYSEIIISDNKNNAKKEALNNFYMLIKDLWKETINRRDIKIECEYVSWLIYDGEETNMKLIKALKNSEIS